MVLLHSELIKTFMVYEQYISRISLFVNCIFTVVIYYVRFSLNECHTMSDADNIYSLFRTERS